MEPQRFAVTVAAAGRGNLLVPVPFNPDHVWGAKQRHHVAGTVNGTRVRAVVEAAGDGFAHRLTLTARLRYHRADVDRALWTGERRIAFKY